MLLVVSYRNSTSNHNIITLRSVSITLYLIEILHQTTTMFVAILLLSRLYLIEILHQTTTSRTTMLHRLKLYLIEILHQTTTIRRSFYSVDSCILSKFYIKPQQQTIKLQSNSVVSYRNSTSNHNGFQHVCIRVLVVSYRNSTSNHNVWLSKATHKRLYLIEILHQTTTALCLASTQLCCILSKFYIKPQLSYDRRCSRCVVSYRNSTSNHNRSCRRRTVVSVVSYRNSTSNHNGRPCMAFTIRVVSYRNSTSNHNEKPGWVLKGDVVSYRNSTSNHNTTVAILDAIVLYLIEILHQTTTAYHHPSSPRSLYLIEILHQTTTLSRVHFPALSLYLIEILHQTTTPPPQKRNSVKLYLIEILHQTTTTQESIIKRRRLYLIEILHQTTTLGLASPASRRCILSKFYIKPQLGRSTCSIFDVVSYRNSTSNHNVPLYSYWVQQVVSYRNSTSNHNLLQGFVNC